MIGCSTFGAAASRNRYANRIARPETTDAAMRIAAPAGCGPCRVVVGARCTGRKSPRRSDSRGSDRSLVKNKDSPVPALSTARLLPGAPFDRLGACKFFNAGRKIATGVAGECLFCHPHPALSPQGRGGVLPRIQSPLSLDGRGLGEGDQQVICRRCRLRTNDFRKIHSLSE